MLRRNARAGIAHRKTRMTVSGLLPSHADDAAGRRVAHGIADQIRQGALQFADMAGKLARLRQIRRRRKVQLQGGSARRQNVRCQRSGLLFALRQ